MAMMDYHQSFNLSSDASVLDPYSHLVSVGSHLSSGIERTGGEHFSVAPKAEDVKVFGNILGCRPNTRSTEPRNQPGQFARRRRRKASPGPPNLERDEKYARYRDRARQKSKESKGSKEDVWPDRIEDAFQLALLAIEPMGRKKRMCSDGKLRGRNELIADKIKLWTGEDRDRKKVSSHIQVLKPKLRNNAKWMKNVTSTTDNKSTVPNPPRFPEIDFGAMDEEEIDSYARNRYGNIGQPAYTGGLLLPPPAGILGSNAPDRGPHINRIEFEMFVLSPSKEIFHNYTSNQTDISLRPRPLEDVRNWRTSFPPLVKYYDQCQLDTDIILIESNLDLLSEYPPRNSTLSIRFNVSVTGVSGNEGWSTRAEYFENDGQSVDMRTFYAMNNIRKATPWDTPNMFQGSGKSEVKLEIPLQSTWWVQLFTKMAARKQEARQDACLDKQEEEWSRRYLQEMSIVQELWASPGPGGAGDRPVAVILWKFSQSRAGEAGTTTWKLNPPPERIKVNSPQPSPEPILQHSMVLDTAIQNLAMPQAVSVHTGRFLQNANLFVEDPGQMVTEPHSARESASPALSLDYTTSFPSSTTTSFPPSVTHGHLSHEESQESACYSQESDRSRNGSLDAQYSHMYSQKSTYTYEEPTTYNEDLRYLVEEQAFEMHDTTSYPQHPFDPIPPFHGQSHYEPYDDNSNPVHPFVSHDFTGGQIQLSFQQQREVHSNQLSPCTPDVAHIEHSSRMTCQIDGHELRAATHQYSIGDITSAGHPQRTEFDFSTSNTHFSPEELEALRMQDQEYKSLGEALAKQGAVHDFDDFEHVDGIELGEQVSGNRLDESALGQAGHGVVLGEVEDVAREMDDGFELEAFDNGSQAAQVERGSDGELDDYQYPDDDRHEETP
ncbi:MAG: hypothetical protein Q9170_001769 [Blastenia crenularia]